MTVTWDDKVLNLIEKIRNTKIENYAVNGLALDIYPNVFSPSFFAESLWFAKQLTKIVGNKSLLEVGTGTGIISLFSAKNGANVTVTDINPLAIENAKVNFQKNNLNADFYIGDLFSSIPKNAKYDYIFWNHPFNYADIKYDDYLLNSVFDYKYFSLTKYIHEGFNHLAEKGILLLGTSSIARLEDVERIVRTNNCEMKLYEHTNMPSEVDVDITVEYMIYGIIR